MAGETPRLEPVNMMPEKPCDTFRGSEEDIKQRLRKYLEYFNACQRVLDVGCGRGEFLELLRESHISALGIDMNAEMVEICRGKELDVSLAEACDFLRTGEEAFDGIFCSQVIEHMPPLEAQNFLTLCAKRLKPGGVLVLITLNPRNIRVMTNIFWLDLTHQRPYPLMLLEQMLTKRGFEVLTRGDDRDTVTKGKFPQILRWMDIKLSKGIFFSGVDIFIVGKKPRKADST